MSLPKIVLDTDVVVAGMRSPTGASAEIMRRARQGRMRLAASVPLFMEYEAVCLRFEHRRAACLSVQDVQVFLDGLASLVEPVAVHFLWRPLLNDPADEMVLETAMNANASALLTFNQRHFTQAAGALGLRVLTPSGFLKSL